MWLAQPSRSASHVIDMCNDPPVSAQVTRLILVPQTSD